VKGLSEQPLHLHPQVRGVERLDEPPVAYVLIGRLIPHEEHRDLARGLICAEGPAERDSVKARHPNPGDHQVGTQRSSEKESLAPVGSLRDVNLGVDAEAPRDIRSHVRVGISNEDVRSRIGDGRHEIEEMPAAQESSPAGYAMEPQRGYFRGCRPLPERRMQPPSNESRHICYSGAQPPMACSLQKNDPLQICVGAAVHRRKATPLRSVGGRPGRGRRLRCSRLRCSRLGPRSVLGRDVPEVRAEGA